VHDSHIDVSCSECEHFALAYADEQADVRLRGWGSCRRPGSGILPDPEVVEKLRVRVQGDEPNALRSNTVGLYRSEPEDGCEFFSDIVLPAATAAEGGG